MNQEPTQAAQNIELLAKSILNQGCLFLQVSFTEVIDISLIVITLNLQYFPIYFIHIIKVLKQFKVAYIYVKGINDDSSAGGTTTTTTTTTTASTTTGAEPVQTTTPSVEEQAQAKTQAIQAATAEREQEKEKEEVSSLFFISRHCANHRPRNNAHGFSLN